MMDLIDLGIIAGMLTPLYLYILYYTIRAEGRITRIETRCTIFHGDKDPE